MLTYKFLNRISISLLLVFILLNVIFSISYFWLLALIILWITLTVIGSFHIRWNFFLKAIHANYKVKENVISLTFDDGPNEVFTEKVLDLLDDFNHKATFFLIGNKIEKHPYLVKEIVNRGHTIGNHTYLHSNNYGFLKTEKVISDLNKTTSIVESLLGIKLKLFRPAFGVTNPRISKAVNELKLTPIGWSIRSLDTTKISKEKMFSKITNNLKRGDVILLHDTNEKTIALLEQLLIFLKHKNWSSITIDQLLNIKAYE